MAVFSDLTMVFDQTITDERVKTWAEPYILAGQPFPARLDIYSYQKMKATIVFPPTTEETRESVWAQASFALSLIGGTHILFAHRAEIDVSSTLSADEVNGMSTPCLCSYLSSFVHISGKAHPYVHTSGSDMVLWQSPSDNPPTLELSFLQTFLSQASQMDSRIGNPQIYLQWLIDKGFEIQFYEPFDQQNFAYATR